MIETGDNLGDMAPELRPKQYVSEFESGGPKNYAYRMINTVTGLNDTVCEVRAITLNYNTKQRVNFEVIGDMILGTGGEPPVTVHSKRKNKRKRKGEGELYL